MRELLKKELSLCVHPTSFIFLAFCAFVFIPNYPYEVMFFFSGLSVFFVCLTSRENGDLAYTCALPIKKSGVAAARIVTVCIFQLALIVLASITTAVKELVFDAASQVNMAGSTANTAFIGYGALLLGLFNIIFFPIYFANPDKVGVPFLLASACEFVVIGVLVALRFVSPLFRDCLCAPDPNYMSAKLCVLAVGVCAYASLTAVAAFVSGKKFAKVDL